MDWKKHIGVHPEICHGQTCFRGTRIPIKVVLDNLACGVPREEILENYPSLNDEFITAALVYASELAKDLAMPVV